MSNTTSKAAHTPGPWRVETNSAWARVVCRAGNKFDGATVAEVYNGTANARLIAAAPELLEALKRCKAAVENGNLAPSARLELVRDYTTPAIAKAEGSEP